MVTVYITNYNYGKYITQSIESVLNQSLRDFELLIIDDGSTDNSREIIEKYRQYPGVTIIYQKNKGLNVTNNIAMRAARGSYIMRLDADDYLHPQALEVMSGILDADDKLGLVFPDYFYIDEAGTITGEERRHDFEKEVSLYDQPAHGACTMVRLDFLKELGGYNESFVCQDGYDLWIKFVMHHKLINVNRSLFYYRRHDQNLTTNEDLILTTRQKIKELFVSENKLEIPVTVAIIPVRATLIEKTCWPLWELNGKSVLERLIDKVASASRVSAVVVTTADDNILEYLAGKNVRNPKLSIIRRPAEFAAINESLYRTFDYVLQQLPGSVHPDAVLSVSTEYPFITAELIDDVINTLAIFKADSLLTVRPDNRTYYQHNGAGMKPIMDQEKFTRLEREAIYKPVGGLVISTVESLRKTGSMLGGKVGHVVVNSKVAFEVQTGFDFDLISKFMSDKLALEERESTINR